MTFDFYLVYSGNTGPLRERESCELKRSKVTYSEHSLFMSEFALQKRMKCWSLSKINISFVHKKSFWQNSIHKVQQVLQQEASNWPFHGRIWTKYVVLNFQVDFTCWKEGVASFLFGFPVPFSIWLLEKPITFRQLTK